MLMHDTLSKIKVTVAYRIEYQSMYYGI